MTQNMPKKKQVRQRKAQVDRVGQRTIYADSKTGKLFYRNKSGQRIYLRASGRNRYQRSSMKWASYMAYIASRTRREKYKRKK